MRTSSDRILTSHAGSLPRPNELIEANRARETGDASDERAFQETLRRAVDNVVRRQKELGIDIPGDGEFGKSVANRVNYGAWWNYAFQRLGGLELGGPSLDHMTPRPARPGEIVLTNASRRRDRVRFAAAYADPVSGVFMGPRPSTGPVCVGPLTYTGQDAIKADIANFQAALAAAGIAEGFMTAVAPGSAYRIPNTYYQSDEEFLYACAEAMREEYKAILDAGLVLQLDDPATATGWDMIDPEPTCRGLQEIYDGPRRGVEPCAARPAAGAHSLPSLLGELARPAHHGHRDARHRRGDARRQRRSLFVRSRQCSPRA